ncbi:FAD-dependent oxidoreductase [Streptomyces mashuensis]|uniref:FAD-dependent oxidoreductase n=1 Tax=Streptomyces mashuensis TaxID=33904 RepID=A0A919AWZ6_9ACTN|nr:FAD-dependent monooxygenase [Streptomyces mashuensis]GHF29171.1 FAD-dependent oxidoreductase [Streptomyces mashuensis]
MTHVLIIGGGIAGPVTAMALRRAGIEASVHEAYPRGADRAGAFLVLFANGLAALAAIGADAPVLDHSFPSGTVEYLGDTGRTLGVRPLAGAGPDGTAPRTLPRAVLHRVLREEAARRGIPLAYGRRLVDVVRGPGGKVVAVFADGSRAEGDLIIGADGLHSRTRRVLDPDAPRPRHTGQVTVCGRTRAPGHAAPPGTYRMMYGKHGFFGQVTGPDATTYWFANLPAPEVPRAALAGYTPDRWRRRVTEAFADDGTPAAALAAATGDDIVGINGYDIASVPVWHDDRTVLVGDAAHATAPNAAQGASMAIEDGVVLARCLRDLPDAGQAFAAYERLRRERVERIVALSAAMADRIVRTEGERRVRDAEVERRLAADARDAPDTDGSADWITGYRVDWEEKVC